MNRPAGLRSLAVSFPSVIRPNEYWRRHHPGMVESAEQKALAKLWSNAESSEESEPFDAEMKPYLTDPFRGAVERRVLAPGESAITIERYAARQAIAAAGLAPDDIDLLIVASFMADHLAVGDAAYLAGELGLKGAAWNIESACSGSIVAFRTAAALVQAGEYNRVLVVVSCTYSRNVPETSTLSWFLSDGGGAFVVSVVPPGEGYLGGYTVHTADTCGAFTHELVLDPAAGRPAIEMVAHANTSKVLRDTSAKYLRQCCHKAAEAAGVSLGDIDCFIFNTPTAWFASFAARALEIDPSRTVSTNQFYGNIGPALMPANLHFAARTKALAPGDLVLIYSIGSVSSASAAVMRWGDVRLGADPAGVYDRCPAVQ